MNQTIKKMLMYIEKLLTIYSKNVNLVFKNIKHVLEKSIRYITKMCIEKNVAHVL